MRRIRAAAIAACALLLSLPATTMADAQLVDANPAPGAALAELPDEIVLTFDEPLSDRSSVTVVDGGGATVATGLLDPADPTILRGTLPDLGPGTYVVQWVADSADGHLARDTYEFTVLEPTPPPATPPLATPPLATPSAAPSGAPAPSSTPAPTPAATATSTPTGAGGGTDDTGSILVPIVATLVLLGLALAWLIRRR